MLFDRSELFLATLIKGHPRNSSVKLFQNQVSIFRQEDFLNVLHRRMVKTNPALWWLCILTDLIFLATLVEGHPRNIILKLFQNQNSRLGGDVIQSNCWRTYEGQCVIIIVHLSTTCSWQKSQHCEGRLKNTTTVVTIFHPQILRMLDLLKHLETPPSIVRLH